LARLSFAESALLGGVIYENLGRRETSCGSLDSSEGKSNDGMAKLLNDIGAKAPQEEREE
jgi:hypothetical protein